MAWQDESVTCYANTQEAPNGDPDFIKNYGCLYTWGDANKVCPDGWHLPDKDEFEALVAYVDAHKTSSAAVWSLLYTDNENNLSLGHDEFGFSALIAGAYINGSYTEFSASETTKKASFWSVTELENNNFAYFFGLGPNFGGKMGSSAKENGFSVRCLKTEMQCQHGTPDTTTGHCQSNTCEAGYIGKDCNIESKCAHGTLDSATGHCQAGSCESGFDGEDCDIAVTNINGQIWMVKNMDVTIGADGSSLTCYANSSSNFVEHYGCLYNWYDAMKACPAGWHLPTYDEFDALLTYVDAHKTSSSVFLALIPGTRPPG